MLRHRLTKKKKKIVKFPSSKWTLVKGHTNEWYLFLVFRFYKTSGTSGFLHIYQLANHDRLLACGSEIPLLYRREEAFSKYCPPQTNWPAHLDLHIIPLPDAGRRKRHRAADGGRSRQVEQGDTGLAEWVSAEHCGAAKGNPQTSGAEDYPKYGGTEAAMDKGTATESKEAVH